MNGHFGIPGPGGSLGTCAICGGNFLLEVLTGQSVNSFEVDGITQTLYGHRDCLSKLEGKSFDVLSLPPESPLRRAYESQTPNPPPDTPE